MNQDYTSIAISWLDAYRHKDLDRVLAFYTDDASLECGCGGSKVINGKAALRAYWEDRFAKLPASQLETLVRSSDGASVEYRTPDGIVRIAMHFDQSGFISTAKCGPVSAQLQQDVSLKKVRRPVQRSALRQECLRLRQLIRQCLALAGEVDDPAAAERLKKMAAGYATELDRLTPTQRS